MSGASNIITPVTFHSVIVEIELRDDGDDALTAKRVEAIEKVMRNRLFKSVYRVQDAPGCRVAAFERPFPGYGQWKFLTEDVPKYVEEAARALEGVGINNGGRFYIRVEARAEGLLGATNVPR